MSASTGERRYGGKSASERRAQRREKLLDTALELFGTRGYAATSIEALCAGAGLNARYFYAEFDSREGLLGAVYDRHVAAVFGAVSAAVAAAEPNPRARLAAGLSAFIEHTLADPRAARVNYYEMIGVSAALEGRRREVLAMYVELAAEQLAQLVAIGAQVPGGDLHVAAVALVSATDGLIIDLLSRYETTDSGVPDAAERQALVPALTELFAAAIGA